MREGTIFGYAFLVAFILGTGVIKAQEIGLQIYSLRNEFKNDVPGTFKLIKDWGITKIEDGNDGTQGYTMSEYQQLLKENNLSMVSISATFDELKNNPETVVKRANAYGAKYVVCFWVPHKDNVFTIAETRMAVDVFNKAGKLLKKQGVTLAYHAHGYEFRFYKKGTLFDYMAENAENFAFEMDVYWVKQGGKDPLALLKKYPKKFVLMHMKDRAIGTPENLDGKSDVETNVTLGTGDIDIKGLYAEAKNLGIEYVFIEDESSRSVTQIPKSLQYLKSLHRK
ncbi:sugar phosphate isomerase/epimerase [Flavobacteriaceae bacterium F89]|uniref:Sugar phosphate isomerase/epimerase n=1 Tax=Cerina litoralis TaxID=2874477 RepID=A0AAE3JQH7_9FLAO|nr:sugar phosphate isomerase/epimerase [Cerina litoralis]MCG2462106.1 sugar phosphate isomerase/epimerase [Cerina litoralis]